VSKPPSVTSIQPTSLCSVGGTTDLTLTLLGQNLAAHSEAVLVRANGSLVEPTTKTSNAHQLVLDFGAIAIGNYGARWSVV